jgi:hypothetical protein
MNAAGTQSAGPVEAAEVQPAPVRWYEYAVALSFYVAVTLAFFWPVLAELAHKQIGDGGDGPEFLWNAWWIGRSLLQGRNPFFCDMLYFPYGVPLVWHSLVPLQSTAICLLTAWLPAHVAYNMLVIAAYPLAGICLYALARHVTSNHAAALVGGLVLMLCPYLASKSLGHLDLLYGGLLPLYLLTLLRATEPKSPAPSRRMRMALLGASALLLFSCYVVTICAVNVTAIVFLWRVRSSGNWKMTWSRFLAVFKPTLVMGGAYGAIVLYYSAAYHYPPKSVGPLALCPEPASYLFPFTVTSMWSELVRPLGHPDLGNIELACYLGWGVFPLSVAGLVVRRRHAAARFCAVALALFLVLSMGPKLQWGREVVRLGPVTAYLPFGLWRYVPVLGSIGQTGRYMLIVYCMMGVGAAYLVAALARRYGRGGGLIAAAVCTAVICTDYAFRPWVSDVPAMVRLSGDEGPVLDPRLYNAATMYYQTQHSRPLVGGYVSRIPKAVLARYREAEGLGWLFSRDPAPACDRKTLLRALAKLGVRDVLLDPGDWRAATLEEYGFDRFGEDSTTVTWAVPQQ